MADFKEFIHVQLNTETGGYYCYWEKEDLADESIVDCDWDFETSLSNAIKFLRDHNYDTDYAIRSVVIQDRYSKSDEY